MVVVSSISYTGLIVPNVVSIFKGDKIRGTLADTALFGAIFVLGCDVLGRVVIAPYELSIELIVVLLLHHPSHGNKAVRLMGAVSSGCAAAPKLCGGEET